MADAEPQARGSRYVSLQPIDRETHMYSGYRAPGIGAVATLAVTAMALLLASCGGGGSDEGTNDGGAGVPRPKYAVVVTVNGLGGSSLLLANAGTTMSIVANGTFAFPDTYSTGSNYAVSVVTQPTNPLQSCSVSN